MSCVRGSTSGTLLPLAMKVNRSSTNEAGGSAPVEDVEGALRFKTASPLDKRPFWVALKARSAGNARGHGWGSVACGVICGAKCSACLRAGCMWDVVRDVWGCCCVHSDRFVMTRSMTVPSRKRPTLPMRISWRVGIRGSKAGLPPWPPRLL